MLSVVLCVSKGKWETTVDLLDVSIWKEALDVYTTDFFHFLFPTDDNFAKTGKHHGYC